MNKIYSSLVLLSLIYNCSSLQYSIPDQSFCDKSSKVYALTTGQLMPNHTNKPEIMFIKDNTLWYWPKDEAIKENYWTFTPLLFGSNETYFVAFKLNFIDDNTDCGLEIPSNFFIIVIMIFL